MTTYNAYEHDGFGGLINSRHNARNWCAITDRVVAYRGNLGNQNSLMDRGFGVVKLTWPNPPYTSNPYIADFDGLDRVWSSHNDGTLICSSRDLASVLYTSPTPAAGTYYAVGVCDSDGACYAWYDPGITPADRDHQIVKFAGDLSGIAWTTPNMPSTRGGFDRVWYVQGVIYDNTLSTLTGVYSLRQLDAATGAVNWTLANVSCRTPTPDGGFLGLDRSVVPNVARFYDSAGVATGVTLADTIGVAYTTRRGITYANVPPNRVRVYDKAGVQILERKPTDVLLDAGATWAINQLMVDDCNVPNGEEATIFCTGKLTNPVSGLSPFITWSMTHGGAAITGARSNGSGNVMRINGHWATHT